MRIFLSVLVLPLLSCSHTSMPLPSNQGINFAYSSGSAPGGTFPQVTDSTRVLADGSILGAPDAPICAVDSAASAAWKEVQTPIESRFLGAIAIRLPPGFSPAWFSRPRDPDDEDPEDRADSSNYWGHS